MVPGAKGIDDIEQFALRVFHSSFATVSPASRPLRAEIQDFQSRASAEMFREVMAYALRERGERVLDRALTATEIAALDKPASLLEHTDPGVKYFSGTVTYRTTFESEIQNLKSKIFLDLDLGDVAVIAIVKLKSVLEETPPKKANHEMHLHTLCVL